MAILTAPNSFWKIVWKKSLCKYISHTARLAPNANHDIFVTRIFSPAKEQFGTIAVKVQGVGVFRDLNPSRVNLLFARIESEALQQIGDGIAELFIAEGFCRINFNSIFGTGDLILNLHSQVCRNVNVTRPA